MTAEQILSEISGKLTDVLDKLDLLLGTVGKGWAWLQTPAGTFGVLARVTFGEMLLALLAIGFLSLKAIHMIYDVVAPRGWW